jgi:hypothetical protein
MIYADKYKTMTLFERVMSPVHDVVVYDNQIIDNVEYLVVADEYGVSWLCDLIFWDDLYQNSEHYVRYQKMQNLMNNNLK